MTDFDNNSEERIERLVTTLRELIQSDNQKTRTEFEHTGYSQISEILNNFAKWLQLENRKLNKLLSVVSGINSGFTMEEILENLYEGFRDIIPYNRIGVSLITPDGKTVQAVWAKSDMPHISLDSSYSAPLKGSSLETILKTRRPRILNDLQEYSSEKPTSESTNLILAEGLRSSLTCPLIADGKAIGFMFFSSAEPGTYANVHVETFQQIANLLSLIIAKGRLVDELNQQKRVLEKKNAELNHLENLRNTFLGMAAHDLRSPVAYVQLASTLLLEPETDINNENSRRILSGIQKNATYMLTLLNDLLDISQIESGVLRLAKIPINLYQFLLETIERQSLFAEAKNIHIVLEAQPGGQVYADRMRLQQVIDNLITNAMNFSPPGSEIRVSAKKEEAPYWRIEIQDQGPGIPSQERENLFQEFSRLSTQPIGGERSFGLGLAITKRIIEALDGQIGVESVPGAGALFWITLPSGHDIDPAIAQEE